MAQNQTWTGSVYPGGGRLSTFDQTLLEVLDMAEVSSVDANPAMDAGTSNLKQANVWIAVLALVAVLVLAHMA
jgi:hypothetical protein